MIDNARLSAAQFKCCKCTDDRLHRGFSISSLIDDPALRGRAAVWSLNAIVVAMHFSCTAT